MRRTQYQACVLLVCCFVTIAPSGLMAEESVLSVCELLSDLGRYRDRLVRVRAVVAGGARHGSYLKDLYKEDSCPGLKNWPPAIDLVSTQQTHQIEGPLGFTPDEEVIRAVWGRITEIAPNPKDRKVEAIFIGKIESRRHIEIYRVEENGQLGWMGNGYGHLGQFPAQLIVKSMIDVSVDYQGQRHKIPDETRD